MKTTQFSFTLAVLGWWKTHFVRRGRVGDGDEDERVCVCIYTNDVMWRSNLIADVGRGRGVVDPSGSCYIIGF